MFHCMRARLRIPVALQDDEFRSAGNGRKRQQLTKRNDDMVTLPEGKLYINGKLVAAAGGKTYDDIGPWSGEVVGKAADASADDVNAAINAARDAFDNT